MKGRSHSLRFSTLVSVVSLGVLSPGVCSLVPGTRARSELRLIRESQPPPHRGVQSVKRIATSFFGRYKSSDASKTIVDRLVALSSPLQSYSLNANI